LSIPLPARLRLVSSCLAALLLLSCSSGPEWNSSSLFFFDTVCDIQLWCAPPLAAAARKEVSTIFTDIETEFSPGRVDLASPAVIHLFRAAFRFYRDSDGYFDISVGALSQLWGFSTKAYRVPSSEEVKKTLAVVGTEKIKEGDARLVLPAGMILDWGGIAKGLGVDLAAAALREMGIERGFINCGGDLFCWGENPEGKAWRIGIKHPRGQGFIGVISATGTAVATSGDYQRYFERGGQRYHHIFNPKIGYPARGKQSVTVVGPETLTCDALSTALFASPSPSAIIENYPEYGAIIVDANGNIVTLGKPCSLELF
jgi:thiamine biosynthesis lipoprotein